MAYYFSVRGKKVGFIISSYFSVGLEDLVKVNKVLCCFSDFVKRL